MTKLYSTNALMAVITLKHPISAQDVVITGSKVPVTETTGKRYDFVVHP